MLLLGSARPKRALPRGTDVMSERASGRARMRPSCTDQQLAPATMSPYSI